MAKRAKSNAKTILRIRLQTLHKKMSVSSWLVPVIVGPIRVYRFSLVLYVINHGTIEMSSPLYTPFNMQRSIARGIGPEMRRERLHRRHNGVAKIFEILITALHTVFLRGWREARTVIINQTKNRRKSTQITANG